MHYSCLYSWTHVIRILKGIQICSNYIGFGLWKFYFGQILKKNICIIIKIIINGMFLHDVQAKEEQYIQILFIRNLYVFLNDNIVKIFLKKWLIEDCFILSSLLFLFDTFRSKGSRSKSVVNSVNLCQFLQQTMVDIRWSLSISLSKSTSPSAFRFSGATSGLALRSWFKSTLTRLQHCHLYHPPSL